MNQKNSPLANLLAMILHQNDGRIIIMPKNVQSFDELENNQWQICQTRDSETGSIVVTLDTSSNISHEFAEDLQLNEVAELEQLSMEDQILLLAAL